MILWYRLLYQVIRPLIPLLDLSSLTPPQGNGTTTHTHTPHTPHHVYQPPAVYMIMSSTVFPVICLGVVIILAFLFGGLVYFYCTRLDIMVFHESEREVSHFDLSQNWTPFIITHCLYTHSRAHDRWFFIVENDTIMLLTRLWFSYCHVTTNLCQCLPFCTPLCSLGLEVTTSTALQQLCATLLYRFVPL